MNKFKVGDNIICPKDRGGEESSEGILFVEHMSRYVGKVMKITSIEGDGSLRANGWFWSPEWVELAEDRSTWHPHHDVIVAWAKGAKVRGREKGGDSWRWEWDPLDTGEPAPSWEIDWEYEVIPEPDHTAEIAEIEQEMLKLADRLEKLKRE